MVEERKYEFTWDLIGDIDLGRPHLGNTARLEVYRLMQYCFRDVLEARFGAACADEIFRDVGRLAGAQFAENALVRHESLGDSLSELQRALREMGIGVLRVEHMDADSGAMTMTVSEDLDCSGLPDTGDTTCTYDEGFIAALLESVTGRSYAVREVDCWTTGDRTCRFAATPVPA
jgi:predicted hydrocarbon binding protein